MQRAAVDGTMAFANAPRKPNVFPAHLPVSMAQRAAFNLHQQQQQQQQQLRDASVLKHVDFPDLFGTRS